LLRFPDEERVINNAQAEKLHAQSSKHLVAFLEPSCPLNLLRQKLADFVTVSG
jgi:hypothetical protein